jgi:hypothetical protein
LSDGAYLGLFSLLWDSHCATLENIQSRSANISKSNVNNSRVYPAASVINEEDISEVVELDEQHMEPKKTSFVETKKTKIQLTWKNITIKATVKKGRFQKADDSKDVTILGKTSTKS